MLEFDSPKGDGLLQDRGTLLFANVTPNSVNDLCTSLRADHSTIRHLVAKKLYISRLHPLACHFLLLVYHIVMNDAIEFALSVQTELVGASPISMQENTTILQPLLCNRCPVLLGDGARAGRVKFCKFGLGLEQY